MFARSVKIRSRCVLIGLSTFCLLLLLLSLPDLREQQLGAAPKHHQRRDFLSSVSIGVIPYLNISSHHHLLKFRQTETSTSHNLSSLNNPRMASQTIQQQIRIDTKNTFNTFYASLTPYQKDVLLDVTKVITAQADAIKLNYMIYGGSLLGSFRHHDIIPWDDDVDLVFPFSRRTELFLALKTLSPSYKVVNAGPRVKCFSAESKQMSNYPWAWPYVDIHFYRENDTHIWDSAREFAYYAYKKSDIFPLHRRPLSELSLKAPRDSFAVLRDTYTNVDCETHFYSHKFEVKSGEKTLTVPCEKMKAVVPFVHRTVEGTQVRETLKLGDQVIHSILVDEPTYAITHPYSLKLA